MSKQLITSLILGFLLTAAIPATAQKGKIKKAQSLMEALDYQAAVDILLPLSEKAEDPQIPAMLGHIFRKQNSYNKAAIWYAKAVAIEGVDPAVYYYYGMMLLHTDKCRDAQDQFDFFLSHKPLDPRQFQLRDACAYRQKLLKDEEMLEVEPLLFNSVLSDIGPAFYKNGLVFGSVRSPRVSGPEEPADPFYDLYYVEMQNGHFDFSEPASFSDRINSRVHEAIVTFNTDATMIYFTRNQRGDNEHSSATAAKLEIVYAESEDGIRWSDLQLLPFHSPKYSIAHPSLSPDGAMLFFSSDMPGGFGGKDIYVSQKRGAFWDDPVNLGPLVNTEGDEMFPYYHPSGKLYFSSDGQVGLGGQDIFSTSPNKAGVWDNIENVGAPINTEFDDYGIIVSPEETYGYFTSNRPGGKGKDDIYGFQKPQAETKQEEVLTRRTEEKEEKPVTPEPQPTIQQDVNKVVIHVQVIDASNGQRINNPEIRNCEVNLYRSVGTSSFQMNLYPGDCCEIAVSAPGFKPSKLEICGDPDNKSRAIVLQPYGEDQGMVSKAPETTAPPSRAETSTVDTSQPAAEEKVAETPKPIDAKPGEKIDETVVEISEDVPVTTESVLEEEAPKFKPIEKIDETVVAIPMDVQVPLEPRIEEEAPKFKPIEKIDETVVAMPMDVQVPLEPRIEEEAPKFKPIEKIDETVVAMPMDVEVPSEPLIEAEAPKFQPRIKETVAEKTEEENTPPPVAQTTEEIVVKAGKQEAPKAEDTPTQGEDLEEAVVRADRTVKEKEQTATPAAKDPDTAPEKKSENVITVANEAPKETETSPGVVEETTEIVRQTTRARKTTKYLIGTVYDPLNSRPIPYATIHMLNSTCGVNIKITSDASGHYRLPLVPNCCINIRVEKEGFQTYTALEAICTDKNGSIKGSTSLLLQPEEPKAKPKEVNSEAEMLVNRGVFKDFERSKNTKSGDKSLAFVLNVYYESGRTSVKEESVEDLMKLLKLLEENPTLIVEIGAHTDSRGSDDFNQDLSQRRAENVVKYLVSQGINEKRLIAKGYGESQLINDCNDSKECPESEHQINRRTEFKVIGGLDATE